MGRAAVVAGDQITATCSSHQVPNPATGAPQPAPPMPFAAPLTQGLASTVLVGGKPAAVTGSSGVNTPPHVGLHPADTSMAPPAQRGEVTAGSGTVLFGGKPAVRTGDSCSVCAGASGQLSGSASTVLIG